MAIVETKINRWDGGMVNDPRNPRENTCRVVTNFDVTSSPYKMTPYRQSENGHTSQTNHRIQNFAIARRSGNLNYLWGLGTASSVSNLATIYFKNLNDANDLAGQTWNGGANNNAQSVGSATDFNFFVFYKKTGLIYGARDGTNIWAFDPTSVALFQDSHFALTYTTIAQGVVHSRDDILYVPYDNKIAMNNNGSWTAEALILPSNLFITSIAEFGDYLAIAAAPLANTDNPSTINPATANSSVENSKVFLWDRRSDTVTLRETVDWGEGTLKVLEEVNGYLVGISISRGIHRFKDKISFRYYANAPGSQLPVKAFQFEEFVASAIGAGGTSQVSTLPIAKQKINNRLYFMMFTSIDNDSTIPTRREGVWSVGVIPGIGFNIVHERTPNNDTFLVSPTLHSFFFVGDYLFISYTSNATIAMTKTDDQSVFATSIYESKRFNTGDSSQYKDLLEATVATEYMPTAGQVVLKYRTDQNTAYTTIFTNTTDNSISRSAITGLPKEYKEIQFRIESTGGAEITALIFKESLKGRKYNTA